MSKWLMVAAALLALTAAAALPVGGGTAQSADPKTPSCCTPKAVSMAPELTNLSDSPPEQPVELVFLHHSIGGHLLADPGPEQPNGRVHPNGGGLRRLLEQNNYRVHEATYGSRLGEHTDLFDWLPKFRDQFAEIVRIDEQDKVLPAGRVNRVVMFKSCFPNNFFRGEGVAPGDPAGPELTLANAQATMRALRAEFERHPETLFVFLTTPPIVGIADDEPAYKWLLKKVLGKPTGLEALQEQGRLARAFNDWAASSDGWLKGYPLKNLAVFHFYRALTGDGASNFAAYASGDGRDNHPNGTGNQKAAKQLVPFLNRVVRRAELVPTVTAHVD